MKTLKLNKHSVTNIGSGVSSHKVNNLIELVNLGYKLVCPKSCKQVFSALSKTGLYVQYSSNSAIFYHRDGITFKSNK